MILLDSIGNNAPLSLAVLAGNYIGNLPEENKDAREWSAFCTPFCFIALELSTIEQMDIFSGQKVLFRQLKWGFASLCNSNIFGDMVKDMNVLILWFLCFCKENSPFFTKT